MIRKDIKEFLHDKDLNKIFLKHRPEVDPINYRVGEVEINNTKIICVLNQTTLEIMDFYYDDCPDTEWFDISERYKVVDGTIDPGKYFINRKGVLKSNYKNKFKTILLNEQYPHYELKIINSKNRKGHSKRAQIHRILASIFIPNIAPEERIFIDHIDRNKENYSLDNLKWVTCKENVQNRPTKLFTGKYLYKAYEDKDCTKLVYTFTEKELYNSKFSKERIKNCVSIVSSYNGRSQGYYWKREKP